MDENNARDMLLFSIANSLDILLRQVSRTDGDDAAKARVVMFEAADTLAELIKDRIRLGQAH